MLGVSRLASDSNYMRGEFAIITRSDRQGEGIGWALMNHLIDYARAEGLQELRGQILSENAAMLKMCSELGFRIDPEPPGSGTFTAALSLGHEERQ